MIAKSLASGPKILLLAISLVGGFYGSALLAQSTQSTPAPSTAQAPSTPPTQAKATTPAMGAPSAVPDSKPAAASGSHYQPNRFAGRASQHYAVVWGVDSLSVKWTESGEVIRFKYRVLDANKAKVLNDKKNEPSLIDPQAGVKLVVPSLEKVGQLRQSSTPEEGKSYWMAFSNKGRLVKRGDHVTVVIGQFRAEGLVVD
jgi:hypothetical protein